LTAEEEQDIEDWVICRAQNGYPVAKSELLDSVQQFVLKSKRNNPFSNGRPGRHWYEKFRNRHPNVSNRTAQHLTLNRASVTQEDLKEWFLEVQKYLESKNLLDVDPSRVFNCDETNIQLLPKPDKVIAEKGARSVYKVVNASEKESLTALFMYGADGSRVPPMVMFKFKESVPKRIIECFPVDFSIGVSDGWMTAETFFKYVTNVFYPYLVTKGTQFPVILYFDDHSSHINIPLVKFCREKLIELIVLFPNATYLIQPLDIAFFHPFKESWRKAVSKWKDDNQIKKLKHENFGPVLKQALIIFEEEGKCVQSGFRASGLMPFNPNKVDYNVLQKRIKKKNTLVENDQRADNLENKIEHVNKLDKLDVIKGFEETLPDDLLSQFKDAEVLGQWINDVQNVGLFNHWLHMKSIF